MGVSKGRMVPGETEAPQTPETLLQTHPQFTGGIMLDPRSTGSVNRSLGSDYIPLGAPRRNPSSPFPDETGKRTLETGPSYER